MTWPFHRSEICRHPVIEMRLQYPSVTRQVPWNLNGRFVQTVCLNLKRGFGYRHFWVDWIAPMPE
jgi:hypothetical protein